MWTLRLRDYSPIAESYKNDLSASARTLFDGDKVESGLRSKWTRTTFAIAALLLLIFSNIICFLVSYAILRSNSSQYGCNCIQETSSYSPILEAVDLHPFLMTLNGKLRDNSSIWRMPPSPDVDAMWDYVSAEDMQLITVSAADVVKTDKDPAVAVKAPSSWGRGDDAYIAQVEVYHQIHCLNELRKEMSSNYNYYYKFPPTELHIAHKAHCVHILLQTLMCNADVGIITHNWVHNEAYLAPKTRPFPDFNVVKKCRDFDALSRWLREGGGGVEDLAAKLPLDYSQGMPIIPGDGYAPSTGNST